MIRAAALLGVFLLCSACVLSKEDIDCWYDDVCFGETPHAGR